jgi:hypothetical protein
MLPSSRAILHQVWQATGRTPRAGQTRWRPYESLPWSTQQAILHAAAAGIHLAQTRQISARGSLGALLQHQPARPVYAGDQPSTAGHRYDPMTELRAAIDAARVDPDAAQNLLMVLTSLTRSRAGFDRCRHDLLQLDIPEAFLPTYEQVHPDAEAQPSSAAR